MVTQVTLSAIGRVRLISNSFRDDGLYTQHVRDYFAWRQADCHINNLYNTCFWALVADGEQYLSSQTGNNVLREFLFSCVQHSA